jgi:hypothetical protein
MSKIQAIIFDKRLWDEDQANAYINYHKIYPIKEVHETTNFYRYRLRNPCRICKYRTKEVLPGLKFILMF